MTQPAEKDANGWSSCTCEWRHDASRTPYGIVRVKFDPECPEHEQGPCGCPAGDCVAEDMAANPDAYSCCPDVGFDACTCEHPWAANLTPPASTAQPTEENPK